MADYTAFEPGLAEWLRLVWGARAQIKAGANQWGREEGAGRVYDLYNDPAQDTRATQEWRDFVAILNYFYRKFGLDFWPQDGDWVPHEFYHCSVAPLTPDQGHWRIYGNLASPRNDAMQAPVDLLMTLLVDGGHGVAKFKVAGPGMSTARGDQLVVWMNSEAACTNLLNTLAGYHGCFAGNVPFSVATVAPGLGWAKEPVRGATMSPAIDEVNNADKHSFGSYLAAIIYMGLEQSWDDDEQSYVDEVEEFLLNVGVQPRSPHLLRTLSWVDIRLLAHQANLRLTPLQRVLPPLAVAVDPTHPVPM